jgi:sigma-B regulation protein RsbU (phosphoserine phosphatase)
VSGIGTQPVSEARREDLGGKFNRFWQRVTDGLELNQLWNQFQADARASYRLYSKDVHPAEPRPGAKGHHWFEIASQFFWAVLEKLSPARRVLLLLALVLIFINPQFVWQDQGGTHIFNFDLRFWGGLLMFVLLILEVGDRVVMKRDLQIAREIQMWLLPANPPAVPGLELAFATRPANTVAGDFYDVFRRFPAAEGREAYLVAVADVAGKSIPAALLMATFQASLKTLSSTPSSLKDLVAGMNHYACSNSQGGLRFTTAFIAEYDPVGHGLNYINAGHNAPILRRASGAIERLQAGGLPLGIRDETVYESGSVTLQSGDNLVIFTDGLVEAVNERGEEYGEERLLSVLNIGASQPPPKLLSRIMVDVDLFVGNAPQHDDVTCVLAKAS